LEVGAADGSEGRISTLGVVHASRIRREQPGDGRRWSFYNERGTAEQWIKEGKQAVEMTRLSCRRFRSN